MFRFTRSSILSTLQVPMHILCYIFTCRRFIFIASRSRIYQFLIFNLAESLVSLYSLRTTYIFLLLVVLDSVFARHIWGMSLHFSSFKGYFQTVRFNISICVLLISCCSTISFYIVGLSISVFPINFIL